MSSQSDLFALPSAGSSIAGSQTIAEAQAAIALTPGVDVQAYSARLAALTGLSAAQATALLAITTFVATLLDDADAGTAQSTLGGTTIGKALFTAASAAAAFAAIAPAGATKGDLFAYSGSAWGVLTGGTDGKHLQFDASAPLGWVFV